MNGEARYEARGADALGINRDVEALGTVNREDVSAEEAKSMKMTDACIGKGLVSRML